MYPRHDITTAVYNRVASLLGYEKPAQDHVVCTVSRDRIHDSVLLMVWCQTVNMTLDDATCDDFVFAVLREKDSKELRTDRFDLVCDMQRICNT